MKTNLEFCATKASSKLIEGFLLRTDKCKELI